MIQNRSLTNRLLDYLVYVPVFMMAIFTAIPYYWMVTGAFKPIPELKRVPPSLIIESPTLNNFYDELGDTPPDHQLGLFQRFTDTQGGFLRYYANSVFVTACVTV